MADLPTPPATALDEVYDFRSAEPHWQAAWDAAGCFATNDHPDGRKPKCYVLEMFP